VCEARSGKPANYIIINSNKICGGRNYVIKSLGRKNERAIIFCLKWV